MENSRYYSPGFKTKSEEAMRSSNQGKIQRSGMSIFFMGLPWQSGEKQLTIVWVDHFEEW